MISVLRRMARTFSFAKPRLVRQMTTPLQTTPCLKSGFPTARRFVNFRWEIIGRKVSLMAPKASLLFATGVLVESG